MLAISKKKVYYFSSYNSLILFYEKILKLNKDANFIFILDSQDHCYFLIKDKVDDLIYSQEFLLFKFGEKNIDFMKECLME
jgi:hypothetical protein